MNFTAPPRVMKTPSIIEVHEGHNVTLQCNAVGSPKPTVIWRRQDRQLIRFNGATGYGTTIYNGSTLTISRVSRKHMAEYVCTASNGIPPDAVFNIRLHVLFKPNVKAKVRTVSVPYGGQVNMVCNVEAWPSADVTWSKNGAEILDSEKFVFTIDRREKYFSLHILTVKSVSSDEYDVYRCTAKNDIGQAYDEIVVKGASAN
uniref:Ig-like domain-containing protein n=1 Tax=Syphacia muris TaxID=451379 RepID=A0A0N5ADG6_9BILA